MKLYFSLLKITVLCVMALTATTSRAAEDACLKAARLARSITTNLTSGYLTPTNSERLRQYRQRVQTQAVEWAQAARDCETSSSTLESRRYVVQSLLILAAFNGTNDERGRLTTNLNGWLARTSLDSEERRSHLWTLGLLEGTNQLIEFTRQSLSPAWATPAPLDLGLALAPLVAKNTNAESLDRALLMAHHLRGEGRLALIRALVTNNPAGVPTAESLLTNGLIKFATNGTNLVVPDILLGGVKLSTVTQPWTLIHFWASWNRFSLSQLAELALVHPQLKDRVRFIGVSLDDDETAFQGAVAENKIDWPQHRMTNGWLDPLLVSIPPQALPEMWLLRTNQIARVDLRGGTNELLRAVADK